MISEIEIRLRADIARLQQDMDKARQAVGGALDKIDTAVAKTVGALGGLAVGAAAVSFASFIKQSIDAADALQDLSDRTKIATQDLVGLEFAAKIADTSMEGVAGAVNKLGQNIGAETEKFRKLGITAKDPLEAFKQLADIFKAIQDPQQRAAFGAAALGKSWAEAAPLMEKGGQGIAELIKKGKDLSGVTDQMIQDAGDFNDKLDEITFAVKGVGTSIASDLLPLLKQLTSDMYDSGKAAKSQGDNFSLITEIFRTIVWLGKQVMFTFTAIGNDLGAMAAQIGLTGSALASFFTLDFKGGVEKLRQAFGQGGVGDMAAEDAQKARAALDSWETNWLSLGKTAKTATDSTVAALSAEEEAARKASEQRAADFLNAEKLAAAKKKLADEAAAAAKKEEDAYLSIITGINEKIAATEAEIGTNKQLTDAQKELIKLDAELASGKLKLSGTHEKAARAALSELDALDKLTDMIKVANAAQKELDDQRAASLKTAQQETEDAERKVAEFGKTARAIQELAIARAKERLAQTADPTLDKAEIEHLEHIIELKKRSAAAGETLEALEKQKKATEEAAKDQEDFWKSIDKTAHDTFTSILDGGKNLAQRLKDTLKNTFFDWLYQMTIKKWIVSISATATGGVSGLAQAANAVSGGGSGGAGGDMFSTLGNLVNIFKGDNMSKGMAEGVQKLLDKAGFSMGSGAPGEFAQFAGAAGSTLAGYGMGQGINSLISGKYQTGKGVQTIEKIATAAASAFFGPVGGIVAGAIGGAVNRLFGMGPKELKGTAVTGQFGAQDFTGGQVTQTFFQKGGLFRSNKTTTESQALAADTAATLDKGYAAIKASTAAFALALGQPADAVLGYTKALNMVLTGDAAKDQAAFAKVLTDIGDELAISVLPNLHDFSKEGETASTTLQRVATDFQATSTAITAMGMDADKAFGAVGVASIAARERLVDMAGGIDKFVTQTNFFAQNFLTDAERLAPVQEAVTKSLTDMGLAWVDTREEFKQVVLGLDLATEAGAKEFAALMNLQEAFAAVHQATEESTSVLQQRADIQKEIDQLNMTAAEKERATIDASNLALYDSLQVRKAEKQAIEDAAQAAKELRTSLVDGLRDAVSESVAHIGDLIDAQKKAEKDAFDQVMAGVTANIDLTNNKISKLHDLAQALGSVKFGAGTPQQAAASFQVGSAQIASALAIAKASGALPSADSLQFALKAIGEDISGQFATSEDYQRAQLRAANDINALSKMTDDQLSVEERTLKLLQDQKINAESYYAAQIKDLDAILETARQQADATLKGNNILSTIPGALMTIPGALNELAHVIAALKTTQPVTPPATGGTGGTGSGTGSTGTLNQIRSIEDAYQSVLGRVADAAGLAFYTEALKGGLTLDQVRQDLLNSPEYKALQTTQTVQSASYTAGAQAGTMTQDNTTALLAEMQTLNSQVASLQTSMQQTASNTAASASSGAQLAQQFDQVSAGGGALLVEST